MPEKKKNNKSNKKRMKPGPKKSRRKPVTVYLPAIIPGKDKPYEDFVMSEHEISYEDSLIAIRMEQLAAKGLTNDQIIDALPLSRDTFYKRLKNDPYFSYCLMKHRGKAVADVENALYKNAVGFDYIEQQATASGKVVTVLKQKLPETKAQEFYLTNRKSTEWKKKVETTHELGKGIEALTFAIKRYED